MKINILFLIDCFYGPGAGTERHLYLLASQLNKDKFNCTVCYFEGNNYFINLLQKDGIVVRHIKLKRIYSIHALLQGMRLAKIIKQNRIDLVQTYHFKSDTYGVLIARLMNTSKVVSSRRDTGELKSPRQIYLNKIANRFIDHYIMVCNNIRNGFADKEAISREKMTTIYNGVDLYKFDANAGKRTLEMKKKLGIDMDTFVLGTTAVFRPEKGYDILLEAVYIVSKKIQNLKVLLLGDGPTYESCRNYARIHSLDHVVNFMGYVKEVEKYLPIMDIFCLVPKKNEGLSNAILEAVAMGKPVICTDIGGNAEAVEHNLTGIVIPPDDAESLAQAIELLYKDPTKRTLMGKRARLKAEQEFSVDKMVRKHEELYERLINRIG